ncbi:polysaccharide biosynthesis protein [Actinomyces succiniciruminis]|uniref:polysaccharide biosynthesis protein n=1 Tax=Actinomyces succiniciruminis TaxID=1522002 RepID=UPI001FD586A7|nr:polysaccharide biosynthesis protein [Actinomyces succiniciruminis]
MAKILAMGVAGVFGLVNTRLIIAHFGADAYAQYGLLASFPGLMPFTDLGIGAVVINAVASSSNLAKDTVVRRTLTTALRAMTGSALVIAAVGVCLQVLGLWPAVLGGKLLPGGETAATWCLLIYAAALPLGIGQRVIVGMGRSAVQVLSQAIVSPAMTVLLLVAVAAGVDDGNRVPVFSYAANTLVSIVCLAVACWAAGPLLLDAARDLPRLRSVPGVKIIGTAGPQLVQSLAIPIAFQTDRLLLSHLGQGNSLAEYNLAASMFGLLTQTISVTGVAMWPQFAKARARGRIESPFRPALIFSAIALVLALILVLLTPWAARLLSDGRITLPAVLLVAYALDVVVEAFKQPLGMYMTDPHGLQFQMLPVLVLVPTNFALSWTLIAYCGAAGPILGSALSVIVCQLAPYSWWVRRDLRRRRTAAGAGEEEPESASTSV